MTYQIPQQLVYKEKILFGLTAGQLAYAFPFGFLSLFTFFKSGLPMILSIPIVIILASLGSLFIFFNFGTFLKDFVRWMKFREASKGSQKLQKLIAVQDIAEDYIHV